MNKLIILLFLAMFTINLSCVNNSNRNANLSYEETEKKIQAFLLEKKYKSNIQYIDDTLRIVLYATSEEVHKNKECVFIEYVVYNFLYELSKFNNILFVFEPMNQKSEIIFKRYYDKKALEEVQMKYSYSMYRDLSFYMVDSMNTMDFFTCNGTLKAAYEQSKNNNYNHDIIIIIDNFEHECNGDLKGNINTKILSVLLTVYSDPEFNYYPQMKKHIKYFLDHCNHEKGRMERRA